MDDHQEDFGRLESVVEKLLASYNALKQDKDKLEASLLQKEREILDLQAKVTALKEDRSVIHKRVTGLIGSIEQWEKSHAQSGDRPASLGGVGDLGEGVQPS